MLVPGLGLGGCGSGGGGLSSPVLGGDLSLGALLFLCVRFNAPPFANGHRVPVSLGA